MPMRMLCFLSVIMAQGTSYQSELIHRTKKHTKPELILCYSGNFYGEPPYQTGTEVCSACPADKPYCVGNLCGEFKNITYNT